MKLISRVVVCALISSVFFGKTLAEDEVMNICYASDEGYAIPTCVSIASILANCPSENKLNILVVDTGLSEKSKKAIENLKKIRDFKLEFRKFDMERLKIFKVGKWNPAIRIKLYMNELFPNAEKAMWVNGNIIFRKNIKQLYDVDLTGKYFAGVFGRNGFWDCMVLFNMMLMEREEIFNRMIDYAIRDQQATAIEHFMNETPVKQRAEYGGESICLKYTSAYQSCSVLYFPSLDKCFPWKINKYLFPYAASEMYDEWHKYCDMTDYRGLYERLNANHTAADVVNYYATRLYRLCQKLFIDHFT